MRVDQSCHFCIMDGKTLTITSKDSRNTVSIMLDPSFIQQKLPSLSESPSQDLKAKDWSLINVDDRERTVVKAIAFSQIQFLLDKEESHRGRDVIKAAQEGSTEEVTDLLRTGPISDTHRSVATLKAIELREINMVKSLLASGKIDYLDRTQAIKKAAQLGDLKILLLLIKDASCLSDNYGDALNGAIEGGHEDVVQQILRIFQAPRPFGNPISDYSRGTAVIKAVINGHARILSMILEHGSISPKHRGIALIYAARNGFTIMAQLLLEKGILRQIIGEESILEEGISELLGMEFISRHDREEAVQAATRYGHADIVTLLTSSHLSGLHDSHSSLLLATGLKQLKLKME